MPLPDGMIAVKPAAAGSNLVHPAGGRALPDDGGLWPNDGFTHRRVREGGVTVIPSEEWARRSAAEDAAMLAPAKAEGSEVSAAAPMNIEPSKAPAQVKK